MSTEDYEYTITDVSIATSDPVDGCWVTAIAECAVNHRGSSATSFGYATDAFLSQELVDRAVSEAVERATLTLTVSHQNQLAEVRPPTTTGCAVHPNVVLARRYAQAEARTHIEFIRAFHRRRMGHRQFVRLPRWLASQTAEVCAWRSSDGDSVFSAIKDNQAQPKLLMNARSIHSASTPRTIELSLLESVQSRPWIRWEARLSQHEPIGLEPTITSARQRALHWSSVPDPIVDRVWNELLAVKGSAQQDAPQHTRADENNESAGRMRFEVRLRGTNGPILFFARYEDALLDGAYVTSDYECGLAQHDNGGYAFVPHPLI